MQIAVEVQKLFLGLFFYIARVSGATLPAVPHPVLDCIDMIIGIIFEKEDARILIFGPKREFCVEGVTPLGEVIGDVNNESVFRSSPTAAQWLDQFLKCRAARNYDHI